MEKTVKRANQWLKVVAVLAAFLLLLVGLSILHIGDSAVATEMAAQTITVSNATVNRGMEFDLDISIDNNEQGIQAILLNVTYDPSVMTIIGVTSYTPDPSLKENWTSAFDSSGKDGDGTYNSYGTKAFRLLWTNNDKFFGEGKIATLHFLSKSSAAAKDYTVNVDADPNNTLLDIGQRRDIEISGGTVHMLPGVYSIFLYDAYGNEYAFEESNTESVTIEKALESRSGYTPTKESTSKYIYTFRGWHELQSGDHPKYEPTYTATPVKYDITFKKGVLYDGANEIVYTGEDASEHTITLPYAKIINYDAEVPTPFAADYSFLGWYKDPACTQPVDFVTMPDQDKTVYGYFKVNADEPGVTTTALKTETSFVTEDGVDYVLATVSVTKNFGINSIRFAPEFDPEKLEFVGFLYESDSPFFGTVVPVYPEINDDIKAHANVVDSWQFLASDESIANKYFLFLNENENIFTTGKLITFKYKVIAEGSSETSVSFGNRDLTRYGATGGIYYANAVMDKATVNVVRVVKPTAYSAKESYVYDPAPSASITYAFKTKGGESYYTLANNVKKAVGEYAVTVTLNEIEDTLVTWEDGSKDVLSFDYEITPFVVTKPIATDAEYVYKAAPHYFEFTQESKVHSAYYTVTGDEETLAGEYTVTAKLKDAANFVWEGGSTAALQYPFVIKRIRVVKPTAYTAEDNKSYTFNPGTTVPYSYNNDGENVTYEFKAEDNASKVHYTVDGNVSKAVGEHTVTVSLVDPDNTEWADNNDTVDTDDLEFSFVIGKYVLTTPSVKPKQYTGEPLTADVTLPQNSPFRVEPQTPHTEIGTYEVVFTIEDDFKTKYEWAQPVSAGSLSSIAQFLITAVPVNDWTTAPYANSKTYDGTPVTVGAAAKYGNVIIVEYRLQSGTDADYTTVAPVDAGAYFARFSVPAEAGGAYPELTCDPIPFEIYKVRLNKPVPFTAEEKTYTYSGETIDYVFKQAGNGEIYEVTGNQYTDAGNYTVTASIKEAYRTNYIWKGEPPEGDTLEDQTYPFVIHKAQLAIPVAADRAYIYNGAEQTFEFSVVELSGRYTITGNKQKEAGIYEVTAEITDKTNYCWVGGSTDTQTFRFEIRYAVLTDTTDDYSVSVTTADGFSADSALTLLTNAVDGAEVLADIAAADKKGALGQLTDAAAAALLSDKCFVASLSLSVLPTVSEGEYETVLTLPAARQGVVVVRFVDDDVEVFAVTQTDNVIRFISDGIGDAIILADHTYIYEVATPEYLVSPANCEEAAVYYKSCSCGVTDGETTFVYGEPLGHDYDMTKITWTWSADHLTATAKVVCRRDPDHILIFSGEDVTVNVVERVASGPQTTGRVVRRASVTYKGDTYTNDNTEIIPAGHVFTDPHPVWKRTETPTGYTYKATFVCDCGESVVVKDATVTVDVTTEKIIYNAAVDFQGVTYRYSEEIDRPYVLFEFNDGSEDHEVSFLMLPGESVPFIDKNGHDREGHIFIGWRDEAGTLIIKGENGEYFDYTIGYEPLLFTAEWTRLTTVDVHVQDTDGQIIVGATVALYDETGREYIGETTLTGDATFPQVPFGNYKLVVTYPYTDGTDIVRSTYLDVKEPPVPEGEGVHTTVVLPRVKFHTLVEGVGSAEGLDVAISEEEKEKISDSATGGTINEIVITQRRVTTVAEEIKDQLQAEVRVSAGNSLAQLIDFYDVTMIKTTTVRNTLGDDTYITQEIIKVADSFQTNIFPISTALREEIAAVNGTVDNIFVYKRHVYDPDIVVIQNLPKFSEEEGANAEEECFFIKHVAGEEYIAIRQKEYSVIAFGVSPAPVLINNEITQLTIEDWMYGETPSQPVVRAKYNEELAIVTYSTEKDGEYTPTVPTNAGVYYIKAYIPATGEYAGAEKSGVRFEIKKKPLSDYGTITFENKQFWFNGKRHSIYVEGDLPEGVSVEYQGNDEFELGKFTVVAVFVSTDPNIDVSERMMAVMHIRLNWIPILILIIVALLLIILVIIIVEKLLKKSKEGEDNPPPDEEESDAQDEGKEGSDNE